MQSKVKYRIHAILSKNEFLDNVSEGNLGGERVPVEDDGVPLVAVPAVQLHTPTACTGVRLELVYICTLVNLNGIGVNTPFYKWGRKQDI